MGNEKTRHLSLDTFRGITIASMILVNNPGSWEFVYPPLRHASWNGCTPTDLIFPFFLFIVGVAITLSLSKRKEEGANHTSLIFKIIKRTFLIFLVGLFLNAFPNFNFSELRIPGVLQRIAVVYCIASIIFLKAGWKTILSLSFIFLLLYWAVITLIPVPGLGAPLLGKAALIDPATGIRINGNIAGWLDNLLLNGHLWGATRIWDPEGILSTIPAISTCLSGVLLGLFLQSNYDSANKTARILIAGNLLFFAGLVWDLAFPMNKSLWTSSYVLYTTGLALIVFALCYWFADVKKYTGWTKPFVIYGTNAIAVYFLSGIAAELLYTLTITNGAGETVSYGAFLYSTFFTPFFSPYNASLAWGLTYVLFWLGVMWVLYRKKLFIRI